VLEAALALAERAMAAANGEKAEDALTVSEPVGVVSADGSPEVDTEEENGNVAPFTPRMVRSTC